MTIINGRKSFIVEVGHNFSSLYYVLIPYVGSRWLGGGLPACFDSWATIRAAEQRWMAAHG